MVAFNSMGDDVDSFFDEGEGEGEASAHTPAPPAPTETSTLLRRNKIRMSRSIQHFMSMELHLQLQLIELQGLLSQTQHEPRLKGPFPVQLYRSILTSLQSILDKLHSMRCVTSREEWHTVCSPQHSTGCLLTDNFEERPSRFHPSCESRETGDGRKHYPLFLCPILRLQAEGSASSVPSSRGEIAATFGRCDQEP